MTETPDTAQAYGWTVTRGTDGPWRPELRLPNHTCPIKVFFATEDEAWWFIDNVILPRASAKVTLGYVEEAR